MVPPTLTSVISECKGNHRCANGPKSAAVGREDV